MLTSADKTTRVTQVYSELNRKFEEEETQKQAAAQKLPYINLNGYPLDAQALNLLTKQDAQNFGGVVFYREGRNVKIGVLASSPKLKALAEMLVAKSYVVEFYLISPSSFKHWFGGYNLDAKIDYHSENIKISGADPRFKIESIKDLGERIIKASTTEFIEMLLGAALNLEASDIHIEPAGDTIKIRYRLDGMLQDVATLPKDWHHQIISRIKVLSKMKLNITTTPQDGSFSLVFNQSHIDLRVSMIPSTFGESVVMRILRQDKDSLKFEELGITGLAEERILKEMRKPNGMILTTGPTGSGKTTTLYAMLNKLNVPGVKIITLEDPVEYKIGGITQTPIDTQAGMTFAMGLRAILRQDPDIIMVGEMRDLETAETAAQAALTGHVVLSTLHTNDAPSAVPRLLDMGIKPFVLAPSINAVIGQRLVRKLCPDCKEIYKLPANLLSRVEMILKVVPKSSQAEIPTKLVFHHSPGCPKCKGLGYRGRIGVYEIFAISEEIEKLIMSGAATSQIKNQAISEGMLTMIQDGILKALQGITDVEEVFRVTEE